MKHRERGPGRPEIGPPINVRFPMSILNRVDKRAAREGVTRAEMLRRLVEAGLDATEPPRRQRKN